MEAYLHEWRTTSTAERNYLSNSSLGLFFQAHEEGAQQDGQCHDKLTQTSSSGLSPPLSYTGLGQVHCGYHPSENDHSKVRKGAKRMRAAVAYLDYRRRRVQCRRDSETSCDGCRRHQINCIVARSTRPTGHTGPKGPTRPAKLRELKPNTMRRAL